MNPKTLLAKWRRHPNFEGIVAITGVVVIFVGVFAFFGFVLDLEPEPKSPNEIAWEKVAPKLASAEKTSLQAGDKYVGRVKAFFAERKKGARPFADDAFSLWGEWELVNSKLPWSDGDEQSRYLCACFERHIFRSDELKELIEFVVREYLSELNGIEDRLLIDIRADVSDSKAIPLNLQLAIKSDESFKTAYAQIAEQIRSAVELDTGVLVARQLPGFLAYEVGVAIYVRILGVVGARMGLSAGILGAGAALSVETFGVGMLAGFVFDRILKWGMLEAGYDPEGELAAKMCEFLDKTQALLLDGDPQTSVPGLRGELLKLHQAHFKLCSESIKKLVLEGGMQ